MVNSKALLISILLIAFFSSLSHALIINGHNIATVYIRGLVKCTADGNPVPGFPPVSGATVYLTCAGESTDLGRAITDPAGAFTVVVRIVDTILFDPSRCFIKLNLPLVGCAVAPPDGVLTASVSLVNVVQSALGNIANFGINNFIYSIF